VCAQTHLCDSSAKIVSRQTLVAIRDRLRQERRKVVFTNGCFDLFHRGHLESLRQARALGDCLIVGLNSDASVRALKGSGRPVYNEEDRAELLAELECVSYVCLFDENSVENLVCELSPDILVKGGDYTSETIVGHRSVEECGGRVVVVPLWPGFSTSEVLSRIRVLTSF
jgi:D-beta-D-heptose 7-phosphate kinase/D-beta-D-heptose 1-phosphate adenosyltransferase